MFGIREINYRHDESHHGALRPSYQQFLDANDWQDIPADYREDLKARSLHDPIYHKSLLPRLRYSFADAELIRENYAQSWQDFFVLTMLDGQRQGFYLELGASDPCYCNNTWLLHSLFDWRGISIDKRVEIQSQWQQHRPESCFVIADCLVHDFADILEKNSAPRVIDYLQLDLDQGATYQALTRLPHHRYRFRVITFETDVFTGYHLDRDRSRAFLRDHGYELLIDNIAVKNYDTDTWEPFEDWWVAPDLIDARLVDVFGCVDDRTKLPHEIFIRPE